MRQSGMTLRYYAVAPRGGVTTIAGVATSADATAVGFEFAVTRKQRANVRLLGRSRLKLDFENPGDYTTTEDYELAPFGHVTPIARGVVGNVAYANYLLGRAGSRGHGRAPNTAEARVMRRIDDVLVASFRPTDLEIHVIANTP